MLRRSTLCIVLMFLPVGLLVAHFAFAGVPSAEEPKEKVVEATKAKEEKTPELKEGTSYVMTAELECEIKKVLETAVWAEVTSVRSVSQGVPILTNIPHVNRTFRYVGSVDQESKVTILIPKDQIKAIAPLPAEDNSQE